MSARCLADTALVMGRSFHAGWGPNSTLLTLNTQKAAAVVPLRAGLWDLSVFTSGRTEGDCSQSIVQRLQICGGGIDSSFSNMEVIEGHLRVQLQHSEMKVEADCPLLVPITGVDALHAHCALSDRLNNEQSDPLIVYYQQVWNLCVALWGSLPDLGKYGVQYLKL
ncbi:hypothetical protein C0J52_23222 [Blattella germanica]|nr:hypothetical protein C0J52_23222 [Blattella germanica]